MNRRVALVVTGRLEHRALSTALERLFPTVGFVIARAQSEENLRSFTSARVDPDSLAASYLEAKLSRRELLPAVDELVEALASELCLRDPPALCVLIDDLELANRGNEPGVVRAVREAASRHLETVRARPQLPRNLADLMRERASFHLFDPMVEAYFFEDPAALDKAQGRLARPAYRVPGLDVERFEVEAAREGPYHGPVGECARHRRPRDRKCPWGGADRGPHPKKYLKYLCREDPPNEFCSSYQETEGGAQALATLNWDRVLQSPGSAPFLRALVEDLEEALGIAPAIAGWPSIPMSTAITARSNAPSERVMRNL